MKQYISSINNLAAISSSMEMREWEFELGLIKKFFRLTEENRGLFFALLGKETDLDSYTTSPVYYALTGRKGLWLYQDENTYVPICWHPNVDGQILVFPPKGEYSAEILKKLLIDLPTPPNGVRIARIKKEEIGRPVFANVKNTLGRVVSLALADETVLDWRYPVRVLSTERVMKMEGAAYLKARNHLRQLPQERVYIEPLSSQHEDLVIEFANRWARKRTDNADEIKELVSPYIEAMKLLHDEVFHVGGHVFFVDGIVQAVTLWELPNTSTKIANAWVNLCNTDHKGLSEFVMQITAESLWNKNIPYLNYGGSETKGLDDYKNKYVPAYSIELSSIDAMIDGADMVLHSLMKIQSMQVAV